MKTKEKNLKNNIGNKIIVFLRSSSLEIRLINDTLMS